MTTSEHFAVYGVSPTWGLSNQLLPMGLPWSFLPRVAMVQYARAEEPEDWAPTDLQNGLTNVRVVSTPIPCFSVACVEWTLRYSQTGEGKATICSGTATWNLSVLPYHETSPCNWIISQLNCWCRLNPPRMNAATSTKQVPSLSFQFTPRSFQPLTGKPKKGGGHRKKTFLSPFKACFKLEYGFAI